MMSDHKKFMKYALSLAQTANNDIPIAALLVKDGKIIAEAVNQKELLYDSTAHAEILAIREAGKVLKRWRLNDLTLYTTLEPCPMCAGAILFSRVNTVVFAAYDSLYGAFGSTINLADTFSLGKPSIIGGVLEDEAKMLLKSFFRQRGKK